MVSKEPGPPGQPRVQDLRLEQEENLKVGSEKQVVGWQAVVTWDPADTPEGRTFTLQCCRCSPSKTAPKQPHSNHIMYRLAEGGGEWNTVKSGLTDGICLVDHLAPGQVGSNTKLGERITHLWFDLPPSSFQYYSTL